MITFSRRLAIINGFVEIPNGNNESTTALTPTQVLALISGSELVTEVDQQFIKLPAVSIVDEYPSDWFAALNAAV